MDLRLDPAERLLRDNARDLLEASADGESLGRWERGETGYSPELWDKMAALGWLGIGITPDSGDADLFSLGLVIQELGRAAVPSPFLTSIADAGYTVSRLGAATDLVDNLAAGAIASFLHDPRLVVDDGVLRGPAVLAEWPGAAAHLVVLARRAGSPVLVGVDPGGVRVESRDAFDNERIGLVHLDGVAVELLSGDLDGGSVESARAASRLLRCAELLGCAEGALDLTVTYMKQRHQFGVPLGSFQAVQHTLADVAIAVDTARLAVYEGLSRLAAGGEVSKASALAQALATRAALDAAVAGAQLHGGVGTIREHRMNFHYRRAKAMALRLGSVPEARRRVLRTHIRPGGPR